MVLLIICILYYPTNLIMFHKKVAVQIVLKICKSQGKSEESNVAIASL
jgi:hypothetical protein